MRKLSLVTIALTVTVFAVLGYAIWAAGQIWKTAPDPSKTAAVEVERGEGTSAIAVRLEEADLIESKWLFKWWARLSGKSDSLKAGNYALPEGEGIANLVRYLHEGSHQSDVTITIPEGFTLQQIGEVLGEKLHIPLADWQRETGVDSPFEGTMPLLVSKPDSVDLEGYLFPDTYRFAPDASAHDVVATMLATMANRIGEVAPVMYEGQDSLAFPKNIHQILTLASIIEREVMTDADRKVVSGIFWNRLRIGMALQADSTINYVTGKKTPGVSSEDLQIDSPYNTYKYPGLPPGPISNPGLASIEAAANPGSTDYYYFLTTEDGVVIYAKTNDEHVANKQRYR